MQIMVYLGHIFGDTIYTALTILKFLLHFWWKNAPRVFRIDFFFAFFKQFLSI
jgi:hypothetical protein